MRGVAGEPDVRKGKFVGICCGALHSYTRLKCAVLWMFRFCVLSFVCIHLIHVYILKNRQKWMADPSYDPTGHLSSSCLKTLQNRSPKRKKAEPERRNVCEFLLAPAPPTPTERSAGHCAAVKEIIPGIPSQAIRHHCGAVQEGITAQESYMYRFSQWRIYILH